MPHLLRHEFPNQHWVPLLPFVDLSTFELWEQVLQLLEMEDGGIDKN